MTVVAATAVETSVELTAINPSPSQIEVLGESQFHVQSILISVGGATTDLFRFLTSLYENIPVVSVSDLTISSLTGDPIAQMQLSFYLSPAPIEEEESS